MDKRYYGKVIDMKEYNYKYFDFFKSGTPFQLTYKLGGYHENYPTIDISLFGFMLVLKFPFGKKWTSFRDAPEWGIAYHNQMFWIYRGTHKWWTIKAPFYPELFRKGYLLSDGSWTYRYHNEIQPRKSTLWQENYPYTYILKSGEVQKCTARVRVIEIEHRWNWFKWLSFSKKVNRIMEVKYGEGIGEGFDDWKGEVFECGCSMLPNETPLDCLRRMEIERKF